MPDFLAAAFETRTPVADIALRLVFACLFGAAIGIDREVRGRAAGMRTHMMTALAAAGFTLLSMEMLLDARNEGSTDLDPIRAVQAIAQGVAFLAAGAIIQSAGSVRGLTTGAGIWVAGAVGLACGAGYLSIAVGMTVLALLILWPLRIIETALPHPDDENGKKR